MKTLQFIIFFFLYINLSYSQNRRLIPASNLEKENPNYWLYRANQEEKRGNYTQAITFYEYAGKLGSVMDLINSKIINAKQKIIDRERKLTLLAIKKQKLAEKAQRQTSIEKKKVEAARLATEAQRDRAKTEQQKAEKRARAAENSTLSERLKEQDPTLALRIAEYNLIRHTDNPITHPIFSQFTADTLTVYYKNRFSINHHPLHPHAYSTLIKMSDNGEFALEARSDGYVSLRNLSNNDVKHSQVSNSEQLGGAISSITLSSDGNWAVLCNSKTATLLDLSSGKIQISQLLEPKISGFTISSVAISADGKRVIIGGYLHDNNDIYTVNDKGIILLWDLTTKCAKVTQTLSYKNITKITSVALSADGKWALTGGLIPDFKNANNVYNKGVAVLWNLTSAKPKVTQTLKYEKNSYIQSVDISHNGKVAITNEYLGNPLVWILTKGKITHTYKLKLTDNDYTILVKLSTDGKWAITDNNKVTTLWNLGELRPRINRILKYRPDGLSTNGNWALTDNGSNILLWNLKTHKFSQLQYHGNKNKYFFSDIDSSPDGKLIITKGGYLTNPIYLVLWNLVNGKSKVFQFENKYPHTTSFAFLKDSQRVLTVNDSSVATFWKLSSDTLRAIKRMKLEKVEDVINSIAISDDSKSALFVSHKNQVTLWSISNDTLIFIQKLNPKDITGRIVSATFSGDGKWALTIDDNERISKVKVIDLLGLTPPRLINNYDEYFTFSLSADAKWVLSYSSKEEKLKLYDSSTGKIILTANIPDLEKAIIMPDCKQILTINLNGLIKYLEIPNIFLENHVYKFSIAELKEKGVQLEPEDEKELKNQTNK